MNEFIIQEGYQKRGRCACESLRRGAAGRRMLTTRCRRETRVSRRFLLRRTPPRRRSVIKVMIALHNFLREWRDSAARAVAADAGRCAGLLACLLEAARCVSLPRSRRLGPPLLLLRSKGRVASSLALDERQLGHSDTWISAATTLEIHARVQLVPELRPDLVDLEEEASELRDQSAGSSSSLSFAIFPCRLIDNGPSANNF